MIGEKLKEWREQQGLSQTKVGELLGITREYVGRIEAGKKPSATLVMQIERVISDENREQFAINDHNKRPSDPPPTFPAITFQTLDAGLSEMDDDWLIRQADYFYNDIMNADDCRTRLTHIGTLANMLKEMQDRLVLEWQGKRGHFPNAFSVLHKKKPHGLYLTDHPVQKVAEGKKARGILPTDRTDEEKP